jgi:fibronectin-binding autotransporter adhesin
VLISTGTLKLGGNGSGANSPLGTTNGITTVAAGATLDLNGTSLATFEALTLNGTGVGGTAGALTNSSAITAATYKGPITLATAPVSIVASNADLNITGTITAAAVALTLDGTTNGSISGVIGTGAANVTKAGSGTWTLSAANTFGNASTASCSQVAPCVLRPMLERSALGH